MHHSAETQMFFIIIRTIKAALTSLFVMQKYTRILQSFREVEWPAADGRLLNLFIVL